MTSGGVQALEENRKDQDPVRDYYNRTSDNEWERLQRHKIEFWTTLRALEEFIEADSSVADIGGGPGRYAIELTQRGHEVVLVDLSEANVELARQKAAKHGMEFEAVQGDACDLEFLTDEQFDAVLLMGPLYHLVSKPRRERAVKEALRILRPGGVLFAAFITRFAFILDFLKRNPAVLLEYSEGKLNQLLETGISRPTGSGGFTHAYFVDPWEVVPWLEGLGVQTKRFFAPDGFISMVEPKLYDCGVEVQKAWANFCYEWGTNPSAWGTAEHLLYVGRKPN
jgi:ubiquinone/menaquinone biosynthesis C-methylase UbiE